jgi:hypothetical protein
MDHNGTTPLRDGYVAEAMSLIATAQQLIDEADKLLERAACAIEQHEHSTDEPSVPSAHHFTGDGHR